MSYVRRLDLFRINQTKDEASQPSASPPNPVKAWLDSLSEGGDMPRKVEVSAPSF